MPSDGPAAVGPAKLVGARVKRVEDPRFLTGRGRYVGDLKLPRMAAMVVVRSLYAHARIRGIDAAAARRLPGVLAVFTGADLKERLRPLRADLDRVKNPSYKACDWYQVAWDKVRYVGDPVAIVIAEDPYTAEDAAALVEVDYEPLPALVDPEKAVAEKRVLVHEEWGDNVLCHTDFSTGDVDGAFGRAAAVVRERFRTNRHHALPLEPRGCVATFDPIDGQLTVWSSSQMPHMVRTKLAEALDRPENKIRVVAPDVGGGFGLKCHLFPEEVLTAFAATAVERPVKWLEDRRESFLASFHARDEIVEGELAVDRDGTILAARLRAIADIGAYSAFPWTSAFEVLHTAQMFPGPYRIRSYAFSATSVATNKSTLSTYRGVGAPVATLAMERLLDLAAGRLGIDPVDIRRRNLIRREEFPYTSVTGMPYEIGGYLECLEKAVEIAGYGELRREQAALRERGVCRGIGIGCYNEITALGSSYWHGIGVPMSAYEAANIKIDPSGHVTVYCGTHSHGQAHETVYAQIVSDELAIPFEKITVRLGDTNDTPYGWGTWGSRAAVTGGGAIIHCARKVAAKIRRLAGHYLEASADDIELVDGRAHVKGVPGRSIAIAEVAKRSIFTTAADLPANEEPGLDATHYYDPPPVTFPNATHIAVVDVDAATGFVRIVRYVVVEDCGRMINPMVVDGQITGGVAQGLGGAMFEHLVFDENGQPLTTSLMDYLVPTAADVPFVEIGHVETPSPLVPGGFKGAGEGGTIAPAAALANAIADALAPFGARVREMPFSPERVFRMTQPAHA
ncbi:MAG TPA: xanthine dehydrogenase family protein molybdopterin-binding subunit [Acidimicrobiia bacterium]|jgi:carbon-monoxide dehydrogenase large subunit|nr:xanthine dehydrogenase family protein molybdopterin-binding subunit [Acidimicrobiia bacterium]